MNSHYHIYNSNSYPSPLYVKHWGGNHYIMLVGDRIARTRYFCETPISYAKLAWLFNSMQLPTPIDDKNDNWTDQRVQEVFYKYLTLLEITEEDIIRVYPNLYELGIP